MMLVVLIAGIGLLLAGLVTVALGIQLDLSFGNTLILAGAIVACTGVIMLGLWAIVRELKNLVLQTGSGAAAPSRAEARESDGLPFGRDQAAVAVPMPNRPHHHPR